MLHVVISGSGKTLLGVEVTKGGVQKLNLQNLPQNPPPPLFYTWAQAKINYLCTVIMSSEFVLLVFTDPSPSLSKGELLHI